MYTAQEIESLINARLPQHIRLVQIWETLSKEDFITVLFNLVGTKIHRAVNIFQNEERVNLNVSNIYSYDEDYTSEKTKREDSTDCLLTWLNDFLPNVFSDTPMTQAFDSAVQNTKELVISKVRNVSSLYQSMYIHSETKTYEYSILGVASVGSKNPEAYLLINRNNFYIGAGNTFEEAVKLSIEYGMTASEVKMKVKIITPSMSQEELQQLKELLNKARTILNSPEANVFVCNDEENKELVLFGECNREGVYCTVSSQSISDDWM